MLTTITINVTSTGYLIQTNLINLKDISSLPKQGEWMPLISFVDAFDGEEKLTSCLWQMPHSQANFTQRAVCFDTKKTEEGDLFYTWESRWSKSIQNWINYSKHFSHIKSTKLIRSVMTLYSPGQSSSTVRTSGSEMFKLIWWNF